MIDRRPISFFQSIHLRTKLANHQLENTAAYLIPQESSEGLLVILDREIIADSSIVNFILSLLETMELKEYDNLEDIPLSAIDYSRASNALKKSGYSNINQVFELIRDYDLDNLLAIRNFGEKSANEVLACLVNLHLPPSLFDESFDVLLFEMYGREKLLNLNFPVNRIDTAETLAKQPKNAYMIRGRHVIQKNPNTPEVTKTKNGDGFWKSLRRRLGI